MFWGTRAGWGWGRKLFQLSEQKKCPVTSYIFVVLQFVTNIFYFHYKIVVPAGVSRSYDTSFRFVYS